MARRAAVPHLAFVACLTAACGGGGSAPTTPTGPASATLVVLVSPTPLSAVADPAGSAGICRVTANLTFQESGGKAVKVTALAVTIDSSTSAWTASVRTDVSIAVEARGSVSYALQTAFVAGGADPSARWRLDVTAADQDGRAVTVAPVQAVLSVPTPPAADEVFVGAGDMDGCDRQEPEYTARLLDRIPGTVFTAGDNVYPSGTLSNYQQCYGPRWGRHLSRTYATPGNHDYEADRGSSYFAYFGSAAGPAGLGYYSLTLGAWHVVMMNSMLPMQAGSSQYEWLRQDLAASPAACTIAVWHHPLYSSGQNGGSTFVRDAWRLLLQAGADVVVNGDDHIYERFAPQDADGRASARGIRQFVVGTGGYPLYERGRTQANSEVFENRTFGVLKLTLKTGRFDWEFVPIDGQTFRDSGSGACVVPAAR